MNFFLDGFNRLRETVVNMVLGFSVVSYVSGENDLEDESNVIEEDLVRLTDLRLRYNEHLTATAAQFKSMETLRVHVCTWNVCEGAPPNTVDLVPWLRTEIRRWQKNDTSNMSSQHVGIYHESEPLPPPQDSHQNVIPDIIAIGLQEVDMGTSSVVFERTSKGIAWEPALYRAVNSLDSTSEEHYEKVCSAQLVGILLCVYVKRKHFVNVHNVRTCVSRTGAMQVMGNKGAIAARMTVYSKRFLFICAHLTPHEQNQEQRNRSYFSIIRQLHFDLPSVADDETDMSGQYFEATYGKKNEISSHDISDMDSNPTDSKLDRSRNRFPSEIFKRNSSDALDKSMNDFLNSPTSDAWRTSSLDDVAQPRAIPSFDCVPSPTSSHQGTLKHTQETTPLASTFETLRRNPSFVSPGCPPSWSTARRRTETPPRTESMQRSDSVQDEGMFPAAELPLAETYPYKSDVSENVLFAHDYVFFFGDLNYRVWNVSRDDIRSAIESKNFSSLQKHDQLKQSMLLTDAFRGFREPPINFPPTYKYVTGTFDYNTTRHNPSWTDRILYWCLGENTPLPMDLRVAMHNIQRTGIWSRFSGQESTSRRPRWNSAVKSVQGNLYLEKSESEIDLISNQQKLSRPHKSIFRRVETVPVDLSCLISGGEPLTQKGPEPNDTRECLSFHTRTSTATVCSDHTCPSDDRNLPIEDGTEGMTGGTWNGMGDETSVIHSFAHLEHPKGEHVENKITVRNYDSFPLRLSDHFPVSCSFDVHVVAINGSELRRVLTALEDIASMQK